MPAAPTAVRCIGLPYADNPRGTDGTKALRLSALLLLYHMQPISSYHLPEKNTSIYFFDEFLPSAQHKPRLRGHTRISLTAQRRKQNPKKE